MFDFDGFLSETLNELKDFIKKHWKDYKKDIVNETEEVLNESKEDIQRWVGLVAKGELSRDELEFLLQSKKELIKLKGLEQAGLSLIKIERLRDAIVCLVVENALEKIQL